MPTAKEIADALHADRMTLDEAEAALRGVPRTERPRLTWDEKMLGADIIPGDDNDAAHLMLLVYIGTITYAPTWAGSSV